MLPMTLPQGSPGDGGSHRPGCGVHHLESVERLERPHEAREGKEDPAPGWLSEAPRADVMSSRQFLISFCLLSGICLVFFYFSQRQISDPWIRLALNPEITDHLGKTMQYQRDLANLDPENKARYRAEFEETAALLAHMEVLRTNRKKNRQPLPAPPALGIYPEPPGPWRAPAMASANHEPPALHDQEQPGASGRGRDRSVDCRSWP